MDQDFLDIVIFYGASANTMNMSPTRQFYKFGLAVKLKKSHQTTTKPNIVEFNQGISIAFLGMAKKTPSSFEHG
jgi:hypothetical protein